MTENPNETISTLLSGISVKDDEDNPLSVTVTDDFEEIFLKANDIVLTLNARSSERRYITLSKNISIITDLFTVTVHAADFDATGKTYKGERVIWDALREVRRVCGQSAKSPGGILTWLHVETESQTFKPQLKQGVYQMPLTIRAFHYASLEEP